MTRVRNIKKPWFLSILKGPEYQKTMVFIDSEGSGISKNYGFYRSFRIDKKTMIFIDSEGSGISKNNGFYRSFRIDKKTMVFIDSEGSGYHKTMVFIDPEGSGVPQNYGFLSILKGPLQMRRARSAIIFGGVTRF
jgi:hypothetical protein